MALLPNAYGAPYPLGFAELNAIPRPFAEALVLAGLAAFAANRAGIALMFIAAAALLHPIMALADCAAVLAVLGWEDKRWFWLFALGGALSLLAGWLGVPLLDRLFIAVDPALKSLHESRSPFLFPSQWPAESFPPLIVQAATLAIAAHAQQGRHRSILAAMIVVGLGGIAMAAMFGDWLSSLLIVQAQPWRMAWLMAVAGAMAFGICAVNLWREGPSARIVLALLVLCWSFETQLEVAAPAAILALLLHFRAAHFAPWFTPRRVAAVWIFTLGISAIWQLRLYAYLWHFAMASPAGYGNPELVLMRGFLVLPLCALTVFICRRQAAHQPVSHGCGRCRFADRGLRSLGSPNARPTQDGGKPPAARYCDASRSAPRRSAVDRWAGRDVVCAWPAAMGLAPAGRPDYLFECACRRMAAPDAILDGCAAGRPKMLRTLERTFEC